MRRLVPLVCLVFAAACSGASPTAPTVPLGTPFQLKVGGTAIVPGGLTIRFDQVKSDSRCPATALCILPGEAVVAMTVRSRRVQGEREWVTRAPLNQVAVSSYLIELTLLEPYPLTFTPIPQGDYVATLKVTR